MLFSEIKERAKKAKADKAAQKAAAKAAAPKAAKNVPKGAGKVRGGAGRKWEREAAEGNISSGCEACLGPRLDVCACLGVPCKWVNKAEGACCLVLPLCAGWRALHRPLKAVLVWHVSRAAAAWLHVTKLEQQLQPM